MLDQHILDDIRNTHRRREFAMSTVTRQVLSLQSYMRRGAGYVPEFENKVSADQKRRNAEIKADIAAVLKAAEAVATESTKPVEKRKEVDTNGLNATMLNDATTSFLAMLPMAQVRKQCEKSMTKIVAGLDVWTEFGDGVKGFGEVSAAIVIAELGNPSDYTNPGKVWRRFGVAPFKGKDGRDHLPSSFKGADLSKEQWTELGYSKPRRSKLFVIGDSLLKADSEYSQIYRDRKAAEYRKAELAMLIPMSTTKATVEAWNAKGLPLTYVKSYNPDLHMSAGQMDRRAKVYATKRLLRDFWRAWIKCYGAADQQGYEEYRLRAEAFAPTQEAA